MGAKKGFSLYMQDHSRDTIDISEFSMGSRTPHVDSPSKKVKQKGDFVEKAEDLIHILFPHLDSGEGDFMESTEGSLGMDERDVESNQVLRKPPMLGAFNAVAGPSRIN